MDYFSMKRKKLQSLCKKHGIPANIKNKEMAEKLSAIFEGSGNTDDAGTGSQKDVPMKESDTVAGTDTDITLDQMDASPSGTAGGNEDACQVKSVPSSQELSGDQDKSTMKLPLPERRDDIGFLTMEENSQTHFDVAQVDDNKELHVEALAELHVNSEEFGNNIVEGEVEEVSGKTDVLEEDNQEEVGDEVVYNASNISEASKMCLDASIGTKDIDGKPNSAHKSCFEDSYSTSVDKSVVPVIDAEKPESTMKLPLPERRDDIGFMEENSQTRFDVAQVDDNKELHLDALAESYVISEEFGNNIVEGQVEEVSGKTDVLEEDNQGEVGGEGVYNDSNISEASKTCLDASIGTKDIGGKLKSAHKSCSEDSYSPSVHKSVVLEKPESTMKLPLPERRDDIGFLTVEENSQTRFDVAQVDDNKEFHVEALAESHVISEEFGNNIVEGEVEEVSGKTDVLEEDNQGDVGDEVVYNDCNISEAAKMCLEASIGSKDIDGKRNSAHKLCSEDSDWTPGTAKIEDTCSAKIEHVASEDMEIEAEKLDDTIDLAEDVFGSAKCKDDGNTIFEAATMSNDTSIGAKVCVQIDAEKPAYNFVAVEAEKLDDTIDLAENVLVSGKGKDEAIKQGQNINDSNNILEAATMCNDTSIGAEVCVQIDAEKPANNFVAVENENLDVTNPIDLVEDVSGSEKGKDEAIKQGSNMDDSNNVLEAATMCHDTSIGSKVTDANTDATVEHIPDEVYSSNFKDSDETSVHFPPTDPLSEVKTSDLDVPKTFIPDTCGAEFVDKIGLFDDVESNVAEVEMERLNDMIGSFEDACKAVKDREENVKHGSINTPGEVQMFGDNMLDAIDADTCQNLLNSSQKTGLEAEQEEGMQSDKMEKEDIQVEDSMLVENSVADNDTGGMSHKRKWSDVDNTNDQNSDEKEKTDEFAQTMSKPGKFLGTIYVDEVTDQVKLECLPKGTPIASSKKSIIFSPRNNIKFEKKEQVGSTIPKNKVAKRTALQDLQQH